MIIFKNTYFFRFSSYWKLKNYAASSTLINR